MARRLSRYARLVEHNRPKKPMRHMWSQSSTREIKCVRYGCWELLTSGRPCREKA